MTILFDQRRMRHAGVSEARELQTMLSPGPGPSHGHLSSHPHHTDTGHVPDVTVSPGAAGDTSDNVCTACPLI